MTEATPSLRRLAAALLAATGALHLALVTEYLGEKEAGFLAAAAARPRLLRPSTA